MYLTERVAERISERIILVIFERFSGNDSEEVSEMNWNAQHYNGGLYFPALPSPRLYFKQGLFSSYICGRTGNWGPQEDWY